MRVTYRKYDGSLHWNHGASLLGEDRHGASLDDRVDGSDVGEGRDDDLVAGLQIQAMQRQMQGDGAVADGRDMRIADNLAERGLKTVDEFAP